MKTFTKIFGRIFSQNVSGSENTKVLEPFTIDSRHAVVLSEESLKVPMVGHSADSDSSGSEGRWAQIRHRPVKKTLYWQNPFKIMFPQPQSHNSLVDVFSINLLF